MQLSEVAALLQPEPLPLETGYERLPDGVLHVAVRTDMHNCTGEMFEWWFRWRCDTQKYTWWHPVDHLFSTSAAQPLLPRPGPAGKRGVTARCRARSYDGTGYRPAPACVQRVYFSLSFPAVIACGRAPR